METSTLKTVYLHIGASKTGTSALQYFLLKNRDLLYSKGVNYPEHSLGIDQFSSGNAKWIYDCLKRNDISKIKRQIEDTFNASHSVAILSSEYIYELGEEYIVKLKEILTHIDTKIIIYLRRQDDWLMSAYQQQIKMWSLKSPIDDWFTKEHKRGRYWYKQVRLWAHLFGKENVTVRPYEAQQFVGGSIFSDFLNILGFGLNDGFEVPQKRVNVAYRTDALETMRLLNILPLKTVNSSHLRILLQRYSEHFGKEGDWSYTLFSPAKRLQIAKLYDQENQAIAREYLGRPDGRLFYDPFPDPDEPWKPYPGLSEENIRQIADFLLRHDIKTSIRIKEAVSQGLKSNKTAVQEAARKLSPGFNVFVSQRITLRDYVIYYACRLLDVIRHIKIKKSITATARRLRILR